MARPWRIELSNGRYHVTARGNERRNIFRDDRDRERFVELLAELPERFGVRLHAYVLMPNHYHLLLETPEANLSRTAQWLNVSYSVWFNRRHRRSGHLFQGRFRSVIIEDNAAFQEVGRYVHLNPVRVMRLGLDKARQRAGRLGLAPAPTAAAVSERLAVLRQWRWSSYRSYVGDEPAPSWLWQDVLGRLCGGRTGQERKTALRAYTEEVAREGLAERPWDRLIAGVVLGTKDFARGLRRSAEDSGREQPGVQHLAEPVGWEQIVRAVESVKGEPWEQFRDRHGDWGRDAALWLGRRLGRLRLRELAELIGGLDYTAAGAGVSRFRKRLARDSKLAQRIKQIESRL